MFNLDQATAKTIAALIKEVVAARNTVPVLGTVKVSTDSNYVTTLEATDMDRLLTVKIPNAGLEPGTSALISKDAFAIALAMPTWEPSRAIAPLDTSAADFPTRGATIKGATASDKTMSMAATEFVKLHKVVSPAISKEAARYYLNGMYFDTENSAVVATDGHRLVKQPLDGLPPEWKPAIIHRDTLKAYNILAAKAPKGAHLIFQSCERGLWHSASARLAGDVEIEILGKAIDGAFPDYQRVLPKDNPSALTLNVATALASAKAAAAIDKNHPTLVFNLALGAFECLGQIVASDVFTADQSAAPERERVDRIGVDAKYLKDVATAAKALKANELQIEFSCAAGPMRILPIGQDTEIALMPMRP